MLTIQGMESPLQAAILSTNQRGKYLSFLKGIEYNMLRNATRNSLLIWWLMSESITMRMRKE